MVTLVEGSSFCISGRTGDIDPASPQGLFCRDTRILSAWRLRVDGLAPQPLSVLSGDPFRCRFVARITSTDPLRRAPATGVLPERDRLVGAGMREDLRLRNLGPDPVTCVLTLEAAADFADLFEVKESRVRPREDLYAGADDDGLVLGARAAGRQRGVRICAPGAQISAAGLEFRITLPPRGDWRTTVLVTASVDGADVPGAFPVEHPLEQSAVAQRLRRWRAGSPRVTSEDAALSRTLEQSLEDLGALRLTDPEDPETYAVAAGAPWFMALFGRDSLLTSYMALPLDQNLALGTLRMLARAQGRKVDPMTEEEPGRILHETRLGPQSGLALGGGTVYYGSADATPLFVVLLGELRRWGLAPDSVEALLPHADRALEWIERYGDRDGDGFVEYERRSERGLANQGWKDSPDGVGYADGRIAQAPVALCEVQGYVYSAYVARAHFASKAGDRETADAWAHKASRLRRAFNDAFWLPERGYYAMGLDADKKPIDALASNMGHCLWSGIVDEDKAPQVAARLLSPEMFSGWGIRTLATTMGAYNPMSYHNGSIWPHDNALIAAGLMRYGFVEEAQQVALAILEAAAALGGRLPELFCGFDRSEFPAPIPYPTSCSPQAWAAAAPVQLLRTLLRVDPFLSHSQVWVAPALPTRLGRLRLEDVPVGTARMTLDAYGEGVAVTGLPSGVDLVREPRQPLTAAYSGMR
ncbi:MAG: amylo-alpha-1,6-glucosidase [Actinomycetota bacterium]|nr:amylo-alpha-1,6-glucosidase [Actinomycetota bacterium]